MLLLATAEPSFSALRLWGGDSERLGDLQTLGEQEVYRGTWASLLSDLQPLGGSQGPRDGEQSPALLPFLFPSTLQPSGGCFLSLFGPVPSRIVLWKCRNRGLTPSFSGKLLSAFP